jgi:nicotinamide mononucleotide transporter
MAVYGFWQWRSPADGAGLAVSRWPAARNGWGLAAVVALSAVTAFFLRRYTPAAWPFVDSMVTWASVFATFLVARKVYENWHWWLLIDSTSLLLCFTRRLYLTMLLFALYLVLIGLGMREWRRDLPLVAARAA